MFRWGRRTQQGTVFHLLYLIPSCNRTLPSNRLKRKKEKKRKTPSAGVECLKQSSQRNFNDISLKQPSGRTTYLPLNPVGRTSQEDMEIQFGCPWGLGLRRPSHRENRQRRIPTVQSNLQRHRTGRLDTLDTQLQTQSDGGILSVMSRSACQELYVQLMFPVFLFYFEILFPPELWLSVLYVLF